MSSFGVFMFAFAVCVARDAWAVGGQRARERHLLACSAYWPGRFVLECAGTFAGLWLWSRWYTPLFLFFAGWATVREAVAVAALLRRREVHAPRKAGIHMEVGAPDAKRLTITLTYLACCSHVCYAIEAWRHRHHDDDCEFGPRRHPLADALRRRLSWRKVRLNPAFRPT